MVYTIAARNYNMEHVYWWRGGLIFEHYNNTGMLIYILFLSHGLLILEVVI